MKTDEIEQKSQEAAEILLLASSGLRPDVVYELGLNKRLLAPDVRYTDAPYVAVDEAKRTEAINTLRASLTGEIKDQLATYGDVSVSMFTCLNGDGTQMSNTPEAYIPDRFDENQVFFQRTRILFWMLSEFSRIGIPLNINLVLGDSDLLAYYIPILDEKGVTIDLDRFTARIESLRESLAQFLDFNSAQFNPITQVWRFGNDSVVLSDTRGTGQNGMNIVSLTLNTDLWEYPDLAGLAIDAGDFQDCLADLREWMGNVRKFDPRVFADCSDTLMRKVVKGKFGAYRDQGRYVRTGGRIVLMDELPPQWMCRMLNAGCGDLIFLFPWIRKEDPLRNPDTLEGGVDFQPFDEMRTQQACFSTRFPQ